MYPSRRRIHSGGAEGRQTAILLRAKRRISYACLVSNELEILQDFAFLGRHEWSRRLERASFDVAQLRLDWLVHLGGPFRDRLEQIVDGSPALRLFIAMRPDPVTEFEILHWLKSRSQKNEDRVRLAVYLDPDLPDLEFAKWRTGLEGVSSVFRSALIKREDALGECGDRTPLEGFLRRIIQEHLGKGGPGDALIESYRQIWRENHRSETPWMLLRQWLRVRETRKLTGFPVHRDIERLLAYLSPQNEIAELESLAPGKVMVNPTLEVLTKPLDRQAPLHAIARFKGDIVERELGPLEAALIEAIREDFRIEDTKAIEVALHESPGSTEDVIRALQRLKMEGFVLAAMN